MSVWTQPGCSATTTIPRSRKAAASSAVALFCAA
jgi:hypothetical protein